MYGGDKGVEIPATDVKSVSCLINSDIILKTKDDSYRFSKDSGTGFSKGHPLNPDLIEVAEVGERGGRRIKMKDKRGARAAIELILAMMRTALS